MENLVPIQDYIDLVSRSIPPFIPIPIGQKMYTTDDDGNRTAELILAKINEDNAIIIDIDNGGRMSKWIPMRNDKVSLEDIHERVSISPHTVIFDDYICGDVNLHTLNSRVHMPPSGDIRFHQGDKFIYGYASFVLVNMCDLWGLICTDTGKLYKDHAITKPDAEELDLGDLTMILYNRPKALRNMQHVTCKRD